MAKFKKRILAVDTYHSPDGKVEVTSDRLSHWSDTFRKFRERKIRVPVAWGHNDNSKLSQPHDNGERKPKDTVGYLDSFKLSKGGDSVDIVLDIPDASDSAKLRNDLAEVSPVIFDSWADGKQNQYADCITHVDLVQHPVDNSQSKFEPVIACSFRMGLDTGKPRTFRMADDGFMPKKKKKNDDDTEDEVDEFDEADEADEVDLDDAFEPAAAEETEDLDVPAEPNEADARLVSVLDALRSLDIVLGEDTTAENFLERIETALLTVAAMTSENTDELGGIEDDQLEVAALSLKTRNIHKHADVQHRKEVQTRLSALRDSGRCSTAEFKSQETKVGAIRLNLDSKGEHHASDVEAWIECREAVPEGSCWDPKSKQKRMSKVEAVPHPTMGNQQTEEEAEANADEVFGVAH